MALEPVLGIGVREGGDRAARAGPRVLPGLAGVLVGAGQHIRGRSLGIVEIARCRRGGFGCPKHSRRRRGLDRRSGRLRLAVAAEERIELIGKTAAARRRTERQGECDRLRPQPP